MLQKKKYITPTTRFASIIKIFDHTQFEGKVKIKKKKNLFLHKKFFFESRSISITSNWKLNIASVTTTFNYNKKPYQLLFNSKSIYNQSIFVPGVENLLPGTILYNFTKNINFKYPQYTGSQILLELLPYHSFISFLSNNYNNKWTFIKSSGTFGLKLKAKKTVKLILIKLPSEKVYHFIKNVKCFIGKNYNFLNNKFIEGKWGFTIHKKKKINVRGVAMNPVDHPNGGRTKAKQPEKSPWGWIAKHNK